MPADETQETGSEAPKAAVLAEKFPRRSRFDRSEPPPMEFSLSRKNLILFLISVAALSLLLFAAGVLVGISISLPESMSEDVIEVEPMPPEPEPPVEDVGLPIAPPPPVTMPEEAVQRMPEETPTAGTGAVGAGTEVRDADALPFTVQVGAFGGAANAEKFAEKLRGKGYDAYVYSAVDDRGRQWHCVRVGAYATRQEAVQAAADFKAHEATDAIARPSDSL